MPGIYEDVPIGDMSYDADERLYQYQCPCGDLFQISEVLSAAHRCRRHGALRAAGLT